MPNAPTGFQVTKRVLVGVCSNIQADAQWKDLETLVFKNVIIDLTRLWIDLPQTLGFASCLVLYKREVEGYILSW